MGNPAVLFVARKCFFNARGTGGQSGTWGSSPSHHSTTHQPAAGRPLALVVTDDRLF
jgi:hypothetical protein